MTKKIVLRIAKCEIGDRRDYGFYGEYEKTESGWKRLKKGYPVFRRTSKYKEIKKFLLKKGEDEKFIEGFSSKSLKELIKIRGLKEEFQNYKGDENAKEIQD
mgnify:CR=1 FL=1